MSSTRPRGGNYYVLPARGLSLLDRDAARARLATDMAAFDRAGGRIEVLGTTPLRRRERPLQPKTA